MSKGGAFDAPGVRTTCLHPRYLDPMHIALKVVYIVCSLKRLSSWLPCLALDDIPLNAFLSL